MEGYKFHFNETVLTVWSAPNYCYRCGNVAAILELDEKLNKEFTIFEAAPQVYINCEIPKLAFSGPSKRSTRKEASGRLLFVEIMIFPF